jgi:hypothetical protein
LLCGHERQDVSGVDALALAEYHLDELGFALLALKARLAGLTERRRNEIARREDGERACAADEPDKERKP